ncbi:hypothetical protein CACET_c26360 [Clostridium aceticum]|uniref:Uncharacterized protein n=1 Tax=Clostridium aceticum TaxID=84022 RepID=A0A0D8I696_9CLOT|nr:hypothetical protein [Clostridium aceticum]AKL96081.1 hypothetical protein CACET_c26360 [Clostridium aceticum]KJF25547.1 hypothetical protein TZ02_18270 [Clostridium aceticum]
MAGNEPLCLVLQHEIDEACQKKSGKNKEHGRGYVIRAIELFKKFNTVFRLGPLIDLFPRTDENYNSTVDILPPTENISKITVDILPMTDI